MQVSLAVVRTEKGNINPNTLFFSLRISKTLSIQTAAIILIILIALCDTTKKTSEYFAYFAAKYFKVQSNLKD